MTNTGQHKGLTLDILFPNRVLDIISLSVLTAHFFYLKTTQPSTNTPKAHLSSSIGADIKWRLLVRLDCG